MPEPPAGRQRSAASPSHSTKLPDMVADAIGPGAPTEPEQRRRVQQAAVVELARRGRRDQP